MSAGPREQTTEAVAKAIREHYDFTEYGGYSEALSCCRNAEDHQLHQAQMVADAVVEALGLTEERRVARYTDGEVGLATPVNNDNDANRLLKIYARSVLESRWVSGWSVVGVGGEPT